MSVVFSATASRNVHDVNVKSKNGRTFIIDICQGEAGSYDSTVIVLDGVSSTPGSWLYNVAPATTSASDNFKAAIELVNNYLSSIDPADSISHIHNPCNCPFVTANDQNQILSGLSVNLNVQVN